ncbi:MAG: L-threonylcarbamoyladenylate synthase [Acidobacteriota bacterium]
MITRVLRIDAGAIGSREVAAAADALARGELVAFPTETVYGLGAHAMDEWAVSRLFEVKGRPANDPLIVHVAEVSALADLAETVPPSIDALSHRFWPGALTLILFKRSSVPDLVTAGRPTVAVRVPAHPIAQAILRHARVPVAAPSANTYSRPSPTTAAHVLSDLDGRIELVVDGGATAIGLESTILDLTVNPPLVRRPGAITLEQIRAILPAAESLNQVLTGTAAHPAPGQSLRHYAPRARVTVFVGECAPVVARVAQEARTAAARGEKVGVLAPQEDLLALAPMLAPLASVGRVVTARAGARREPDDVARELFAALRALDEQRVDVILAVAMPPAGIATAIVDRLSRAAEGRVVDVGGVRRG